MRRCGKEVGQKIVVVCEVALSAFLESARDENADELTLESFPVTSFSEFAD